MPRYLNAGASSIISTEFPFAKSLLEPLRGSGNLDKLTDAAEARTNLGLGTLATLSSVTLTSQVSGILPIANGGTAGSTAAAVRAALGVVAAKYVHLSAVKRSRSASVGAYTHETVTVTGGDLGANGFLLVRMSVTGLNTATVGARTVLLTIGGTTVKQFQPAASVNYNMPVEIIFMNRNSESSNIVQSRVDRSDFVWGATTAGVGASGDAGAMAMSVNTASNFDVVISSTSLDAADTCHLQFLQVIAHYAP